jgi:DNA mismatch repair ATPase MutS
MRMIAFPNRALDIYLPRLVARGFRIAIADEMK